MAEENVYWILGCIKVLAETGQDKFNLFLESEKRLVKPEDEVDLSMVLRLIRGATIHGDELVRVGKFK